MTTDQILQIQTKHDSAHGESPDQKIGLFAFFLSPSVWIQRSASNKQQTGGKHDGK